MAKTNFTKVDEALAEGLRQYSIDEMLEYSDIVEESKGKKGLRVSAEKQLERKKKRHLLMARMRHDIDRLFKVEKKLYSAIGTHHEEIEGLFDKIDELDTEGIKRLREIAEALDAYKNKLEEDKPKKDNDSLIEESRKRSVNQRFNVRKNWLPLK